LRTARTTSFYRHTGVALLRSAVASSTDVPDSWPDPSDTTACRSWLDQMWSRSDFAEAIRAASSTLARRVDAIRAGDAAEPKKIRRATVATARYLLRATGRPTPFGLFAGVAPVAVGRPAEVRWGAAHQPIVRADTQWLADIIDRLEACPELLKHLDVSFTDLAVQRGGRLEAPNGPNRVRVRYTAAVRAVQSCAASPVRFGALANKLTETFDKADRSTVVDMLVELVRQRFLVTCLRAPSTTIDPLAHLIDGLNRVSAGTLPATAMLLRDLETASAEMRCHNRSDAGTAQGRLREHLTRQMRTISPAGRTPLALDLRLDCDVSLPAHVVHEVEAAASALLHVSRHPAGLPVWRAYHAAFCDRYGTGTLIPLSDVIDPDAGLGYPAGYPGSVLPAPVDSPFQRDEQLLALAWQAMAESSREIRLTDETLRALNDDRIDEWYIPPHVELAARIHAIDVHALDRGDYLLVVSPARAGGVLTSRFTPTTTGSGLEEVYRALPTVVGGAVPVQLSFPPAYPHAENICRVPAYLPHVLSLGEHRGEGDESIAIPVDDLAITATTDRLHLVSMSRRQVVEPQVLHALAMEKQAPPLARFLAQLPRAFVASWTVLDWGPCADRLPYLPRVRYRRSVLAPARWRLSTSDLTSGGSQREAWSKAVARWRERWGCPRTVDLRDDDRSLRLDLDQSIHIEILRAHLMRHGHAILTESAAEFGWLDDHAHEIVLPLASRCAAAPSPLAGQLPVVTNGDHGQLPGEPDATWLYAKVYAHPERHDELIAEHLSAICTDVTSAADYWFVRHRSAQETDHIRLRVRIPERGLHGVCVASVGRWARRLRCLGLVNGLALDTYRPEVGRYGSGPAMDAAEAVFVADSRVVIAGLRHLPASTMHPIVVAVASMVSIASDFLGLDRAMEWLAACPAPSATAVDQAVAVEAVRRARPDTLPGAFWPAEVTEAWQTRAAALAAYRSRLPDDADIDRIVDSLLHMHHNRGIGIDPTSERTCRRLARAAALAWRAQRERTDR
jgi:thiopeptide-type bacteriocin biosynthesis protein